MLEKQLSRLKHINLLFLFIIVLVILFFEFRSELKSEMIITIILVLFALTLLLFFLNNYINSMMKKNTLHQAKIDNLFNDITAFLVITDGKKLVEVNRSFLDFFHLPSMEAFLEDYECVCDKFLAGDGYLQKKVSLQEDWLEHIVNNPETTHKVKMLDMNDIVNIFQVNFQEYYQYNKIKYIVTFENITALEKELPSRHEKKKKRASFEEMISSVLNIVEESIMSENITIIKDFHSDFEIETFPDEIKQVILNLLKNAEDVLLEQEVKNPFIKIYIYSSESHVHLEISDNGGGIPKDMIENIFDPYISTKVQKDGTELGLYMSKRIVQEYCDGKIKVRNSEDGTVFSIILKK